MTPALETVGRNDARALRRVAVVVGTRPEVIKMAPVVRALEAHPESFVVHLVSTGQHREIVHQAFDSFDLRADVDLNLMRDNQTLAGFASDAIRAVDNVLEEIGPEIVLVQGDTVTVAITAMAARFRKIEVGHVEAGLRSFDDERPFPEEINRRATAALATLHFAPTVGARANLLREGVDPTRIFVTGNTVVDALHSISFSPDFEEPGLRDIDFSSGPVALVTAHRRESHGEGMEDVCLAIADLTRRHPALQVVFPVHPNPNVRETVNRVLKGTPRVHLVPPVDYGDMLRLMSRCSLALSDSGGIQEEAPSFDLPLLILRDVTERPEVVEVGAARLVGANRQRILAVADDILSDPNLYAAMATAPNPFGDGRAAERIASVLANEPMEPFLSSTRPRPLLRDVLASS